MPQTYCRKSGLIAMSDLKPVDGRMDCLGVVVSYSVKWTRSVFHHEKVYLTRFESLQKICADPFVHHKKHTTSKSFII